MKSLLLRVCLLLSALLSGWLWLEFRLTLAIQQPDVSVVNAAGFGSIDRVAPDELVSAFGRFRTLNDQPAIATSLPLPNTLGGVSVKVGEAFAPLLYVSNSQINFLMPSALSAGSATLQVSNSDGSTRTGALAVTTVAPGVFTALGDGRGTAAAQTTFDGVTLTAVANPDGSARSIDPGTRARPNYLILYATGLRRAPAANPNDDNGVAEAVTATVQGIPTQVVYAGSQQGFVGLDQVNLILPPQLAGFGEVQVRLTVAGQAANTVTLRIGGAASLLAPSAISLGQTVSGGLTADDAAINGEEGLGQSYFYDVWRFSVQAAGGVAIDLRSEQFDAAVILYRLLPDGRREFIATDDQTGGLGEGKLENNNALLLAALPEAGDYVVLATSSEIAANAVGGYTMTLRPLTIPKLDYGASISDGVFTSEDVRTSGGAYLKAWWFAGVRGELVRVTFDSTTFDPYLMVNFGGVPFSINDTADAQTGGTNARIERTLPENGVYLIVATPLAAGRTGAFALTLTRVPVG